MRLLQFYTHHWHEFICFQTYFYFKANLITDKAMHGDVIFFLL